MMGTSIDDKEGRGVIPRIVEQIFESILSSPPNIEYTVRVSYMEIYMERIRDLNARGTTFLLIEHNMDMVARLCGRVLVMASGKVLMTGTHDEVVRDRRVVDAYLGGVAA